jgi:hypothetical protein
MIPETFARIKTFRCGIDWAFAALHEQIFPLPHYYAISHLVTVGSAAQTVFSLIVSEQLYGARNSPTASQKTEFKI